MFGTGPFPVASQQRLGGVRFRRGVTDRPSFPVHGWTEALCPGCGATVFEKDAFDPVVGRDAAGSVIATAYHPGCKDEADAIERAKRLL
jgi:hypothetical protein